MTARAASDVERDGAAALRRATFVLGVAQIISWGVLFYGFGVLAPGISADTGWSEPVVAGAFSVAVLVGGLTGPLVARTLVGRDPRVVLSVGSVLGAAAMAAFAAAHSVATFYAAWVLGGVAMAVTLYDPAIAVLVSYDPERPARTIAVLTVVAGLASTVFAPITSVLAADLGWRHTAVLLGVAGGAATLLLHAVALPAPHAHPARVPIIRVARSAISGRVARLRTAMVFEQGAIVATMVHLVGLVATRGGAVATGAAMLAAIGIGKVPGRLLLLGRTARLPLPVLAAAASALQLAGLVAPLLTTGLTPLVAAAVVVGAGAGASTVVRSLLTVELAGASAFAAVNARLQRASSLSRGVAPFALAAVVALAGWTLAWTLALAAYAIAAVGFSSIRSR